MDEEISISNKKLTLTRFRSFLYKNQKYTIFLDTKDLDNDGIPAIYLLLCEDGKYYVPKREILMLLNPICIDILYNNLPYDSQDVKYPKIKLLSWND